MKKETNINLNVWNTKIRVGQALDIYIYIYGQNNAKKFELSTKYKNVQVVLSPSVSMVDQDDTYGFRALSIASSAGKELVHQTLSQSLPVYSTD